MNWGTNFWGLPLLIQRYLRYEAAHEVVVVVVSEQGEALIGDGDRVTVGTGGRAVAGERKKCEQNSLLGWPRHPLAHEGGKMLRCLAAWRAGHVGKIGNLEQCRQLAVQ